MSRLEIKTEIRFLSEKLAETILRSLEPDNIDIPEGVSLNIERKGDSLEVSIQCVFEKILTCRSTIDEILMIISSITRSIENTDTENNK